MTPRRTIAALFLTATLTTLGCRADSNPSGPGATGADGAAAVAEQRLIIVKAAAVWCGPCKRMDETTWRDQKAVAQELCIEAMPTMVGFRPDKEIDRLVGIREPADVTLWLKGLASR